MCTIYIFIKLNYIAPNIINSFFTVDFTITILLKKLVENNGLWLDLETRSLEKKHHAQNYLLRFIFF